MDSLSALNGTIDGLAKQFREFYFDAHRQMFDICVKQMWLERQIVFNGKRRMRRRNGFREDSTYGWFMKSMVGVSQKPIVAGQAFTAVATYLKDLFPEFLDHDPFKEPEYYKYPFKHVTIDHMFLVYKCHERIEMLKYADEHEMNILDFTNWAVNHVLSYNEEVGRTVYSLSTMKYLWPYIKNNEHSQMWSDDCFDFTYVAKA